MPLPPEAPLLLSHPISASDEHQGLRSAALLPGTQHGPFECYTFESYLCRCPQSFALPSVRSLVTAYDVCLYVPMSHSGAGTQGLQ